MKKVLSFFILGVIAFTTINCGGGTASFAGDKEGARALLSEFLKPGADLKKLTMQLKPEKEDYRAFYAEESTAARAEAAFEKLWSGGNAVVAPKEGQSELLLYSATPQELKDHSGEADQFPAGLISMADDLKPGLRVYGFKFVKPGETTGMAFEGLAHVNGKWRLFPKPWRMFQGE